MSYSCTFLGFFIGGTGGHLLIQLLILPVPLVMMHMEYCLLSLWGLLFWWFFLQLGSSSFSWTPKASCHFVLCFFILSPLSLSGIPFAQLFCHLHLSCFSSPLCHITKSTLLFGYFAKLTLPVWQLHIAKLWSSHCPIAWTLFKQPNINHDFSATPIIQNPNIIPYQNHLQQRCMSPKVESTSRLHQPPPTQVTATPYTIVTKCSSKPDSKQ